MKTLGLRTRVTAGFAVGAMLVSVAMALLAYQFAERFLLAERERTAVRATQVDAGIVSAGLATDQPDIATILRTLDTGGKRHAVLRRDGTWYGRTADTITPLIPDGLRRLVESGSPAVQRVRTDTGPAMIIGIPLGAGTAFYVVDSMQELDRSLQVLSMALALAGGVTTGAGAALGWYAARYVVRPLTLVADAARDITAGKLHARLDPATEPDLARLTTSFNQMVDQLSRRMERDRRFAADVSHELRSPLQTMSAAASVLHHRQDGLDPRTAAAAGLVIDEISRFQTLVTDLLELARSDQPADRAPVDIIDLARLTCRSQHLSPSIVTVEPGAAATWNLDRRRIQQALVNLLDNARRHGGGAIAVRIGRQGRANYVEVDDEGPGVNPADRDTIFDRFVRGLSTGARGDDDGTGLGLALVAQHAAAHDGTVTVTDRPGGGARFRMELPEHTL